MKAKFKKFFESIDLTKAQLITVVLCYFLCFALFLGVVVIWDPMSKKSILPSIETEAASTPTNTSGWWITEGRYSIEWFTSSDKETYGDGSESNPYVIDSAEDLAGLSWLVYTKGQEGNPLIEGTDYSGTYIFQGKYFKQTANIDLSAYYWQPIGISSTREETGKHNYFSGSYDGGNHTVSGIFTPAGLSDAYSYQGLFGYVFSASSRYPVTIQNIGVTNSFIQGYNSVGGIVGYASGTTTTITNCYNTGDVSGSDDRVGGVVGYADLNTTIESCYNTGSVSGSGNYVGGVVGYAYTPFISLTITNCYNTGSVSGSSSVGGVVGYAHSPGIITITNCYNTGSVESSGDQVGGVVGYAHSSGIITITNCYNTGDVSGSSSVGGVVGYAYASYDTITITNCYNTGAVSGSGNDVGGVVGYASASSGATITINNCYNTGTVTGSGSYFGGVLGYAHTTSGSGATITITNCYNTGAVSGYSGVGGVVGEASASSGTITITNCYNTGNVTSTATSYSYVGGVVGQAGSNTTIESCYNTGSVTGTATIGSYVGGVVGDAGSNTTITNCYYGANCPSTVGGINGADVTGQAEHSSTLTANSPKTLSWYTTSSNWDSTYPWDFDTIWELNASVNDGYPSFKTDWWIYVGNYSIEWFNNPDTKTYGDGSETNPYIIDSAEDLAGLSYLVYTKGQEGNPLVSGTDYSGSYIFQGKYFKQTANIDLSAYYWQPIGIRYTREGTSRQNYFSGSYDGGNHTVSGIFTPAGSSSAYSYQGLFGYVYSSSSSYPVTIQNIGINNSFIQGYGYVGGVVGRAYVSSGTITITNCYNTGSVESTGSSVGGVVGYASASSGATITITNCYNTGDISGSSNDVGGVVGYATNNYPSTTITITNCYNTGSVESTGSSVGGVVGCAINNYSGATITITNCYNTGAVTGSSRVGGVVGEASASSPGIITITNCYNTGDISGSSNDVGGVVGYATNNYPSTTITITNCYYGGAITGTLGSYGTYLSNITSLAKKLAWYVDKNNWNRACLWDFNLIWQIDSNVNSGYPTIKEFIGYWTQEDRFSIEWYTKPGTNDGSTADNPYIINSAKDLAGLSWLVYTKGQTGNPLKSSDYSGNYIFQGKYFKQTANIDLSAYCWQPIGIEYTREGMTRQNYFSGSYDGGNHTVSGIYTSVGSSYQGLFGTVYSSSSSYPITIKNIGISNSFIQGNGVGGVVGYAGSSGTITITNCYNTGVVSGSGEDVGGVVGYASGSYSGTITITNCYNTGDISGSSNYVGGVVGYASGSYSGTITITNCYNTGDISGSSNYVGGVVGSAYRATITNCYNTGSVSGSSSVGGVVGEATGSATITNCYNTGSVNGSSSVGGVVGYAYASSTTGCNISKSANFGDITVTGSSGNVGGIVGYVRVTNSSYSFKMTNCYSEGSITVKGTDVNVGGFVGSLDANYSTYSNVKIEFCSVDLDIVVSGGSIASQGAFYGGTNGLTIKNSYSLLTKSGTVSKVISDVSTQMDNNFGYMLNFKEGKPIPLGIFHILDVATRTGIVNRINAL